MKKIITFCIAAIALSHMAFAQVNLQLGCIAYYTFDNTLQDSTVNSLDLTSGGSPTLVNDRFGFANSAYQLSAGNLDYFTASTNTLLAPAELTIAAWVNLSNPFNDQKVAGKTSVGPGYLMGVDSNKVDIEIWDANGGYFRMKRGNINANAWTHIAASYKANGYLKVYVNGVVLDSLAASTFGVGTNTATNFTIGGAPWNPFGLNMDGKIDDVCLYDRQLSDAEMAALHALLPTEINLLEASVNDVKIYPTLITNKNIIVEFAKVQKQNMNIIVSDALGNIVGTSSIAPTQKEIINVGDLCSGIYFLTVTSQSGLAEKKKFVVSE